MTGVPPRVSSPALNVRPASAFSPSTSKNGADTMATRRRSGWPCPSRLRLSVLNAAIDWKERARPAQSRKLRYDVDIRANCGADVYSLASRSGSGNGNRSSSTALTMLNIAEFAPMPSAIVRMATTANPGALMSIRMPYRRSATTVPNMVTSLGRPPRDLVGLERLFVPGARQRVAIAMPPRRRRPSLVARETLRERMTRADELDCSGANSHVPEARPLWLSSLRDFEPSSPLPLTLSPCPFALLGLYKKMGPTVTRRPQEEDGKSWALSLI